MKRLAAALERTRATRSRLGKERALAEVIAEMANDPGDDDGLGLATGTRLAAGRILPVGDGRSLGVGGRLMFEVVVAQTGFDGDVVWACARKTGDLGEAFGLLVARIEGTDARPGIALRDLALTLDLLAASGNRVAKRQRLDALFARATPLETKYLSKVMMGSLRTGALEGVLESAIGKAFDVPPEELRRAAALVTDPGVLAVLARDRRLGEARLQLGRPIAFMLATPLETLGRSASAPAGASAGSSIGEVIDAAMHVVEDKIDGVRTQIHKVGGDVSIFARGLDPVTAAFPEVVSAFALMKGSFALDGELVLFTAEGRPRPFQALQARLRRNAPTKAMIAETPVTFVAYDLLADEGGDLLALPWSERRKRLEAFAEARAGHGAFVLNACAPLARDGVTLADRIDVEFTAARARGHEGLVLKRIDAPYDAGRRGQAWIKVKRAFATLDVVITAAEEGHGRRAGVLSDYTFGVWKPADAGERILVNVGKAYSGLTDEEIDTMTRRLERMTIERFGGVRLVRPEIVLEVAFDGVQPSTRHKSGFALRFPRILRIRDDKRAEDGDTLAAVEALFQSQIDTGHREARKGGTETNTDDATQPSTERKAKSRARTGIRGKHDAPKEQLDLFGPSYQSPPQSSTSNSPDTEAVFSPSIAITPRK